MPSISIPEVRKRCKLLKSADISDADLLSYIYESDSYFQLCLGGLYSIPPRPLLFPSGTISGTKGSDVINGTNTAFKTEKILPGQHLFIVDSNETIVIESVTDDLLLKATRFSFIYPNVTEAITVTFDPINNSFTDSQYYIIPEALCTASKYFAAKLAIMDNFSEQAYKQDTKPFFDNYEKFAAKIIEQIENGNYFNSLLVEQEVINNSARLIKTNTQAYRTVIDSRLDGITLNSRKNL